MQDYPRDTWDIQYRFAETSLPEGEKLLYISEE